MAPCNDAIRKPASSSHSVFRGTSPIFTAAFKQYATAWRISSYISTSRFLITSLCTLVLETSMSRGFRGRSEGLQDEHRDFTACTGSVGGDLRIGGVRPLPPF